MNNISPRNRTEFALQGSHASNWICTSLAGSEEKNPSNDKPWKKKTHNAALNTLPLTRSRYAVVCALHGGSNKCTSAGGGVTIKTYVNMAWELRESEDVIKKNVNTSLQQKPLKHLCLTYEATEYGAFTVFMQLIKWRAVTADCGWTGQCPW